MIDEVDSGVAAFFDMDYTLVTANTATMYARWLSRRGLTGRGDVAKTLWWTLRYKLGWLDIAAVVEKVVAGMAGLEEQQMIDRCRLCFSSEVIRHVSPQGRSVVENHRALGHRLVLLTGSSPYLSAPLAAHLDLHDVICTRMEVEDGRFTGRVIEPVCYRDGKVHWAERYAEEHGIDLGKSWFYTDSHTDLPMLERVGHPVAVNPDARLAFQATRRRWQVMAFDPPPRGAAAPPG